jgi:hypothetical protein
VRRLRRLCIDRRIDLIHTNNTGSDRLYGQPSHDLWAAGGEHAARRAV